MTPGLIHSYYLTHCQRIIDLAWPPPPRRLNTGIREGVVRLLHDGPRPGSPESCVDPEAFNDALKALEEQDLELAISAFTDLGYEVTVRTLR